MAVFYDREAPPLPDPNSFCPCSPRFPPRSPRLRGESKADRSGYCRRPPRGVFIGWPNCDPPGGAPNGDVGWGCCPKGEFIGCPICCPIGDPICDAGVPTVACAGFAIGFTFAGSKTN